MAGIHIVNFIQSLNNKEIQVIDDYIHSIYLLSGSNNSESKQLKLFRFIVANNKRKLTDNEISRNIASSNIASLKYLLTEKIYDALLLNKHLQNKTVFNPREQIVFTLKKKMLLAKTLYRTLNQGRIETINSLLTEIKKAAKENEVYDVLSEALTMQKYFKGIRVGIDEFEKINKEIHFYSDCLRSVQNANDSYYRLILNNDFVKSLSDKELDKHIRSSIRQMEEDYKRTGSQEINYYLHIMQFALHEREKNYEQAIAYCNKLINILNKSNVAFSRDRIGFALLNLSQCRILTGDYKAAAADAAKAQEFYIQDSFNYVIAKEQECYALFSMGDYKGAIESIQELLNHSLADTGEFRKSKYIYYHACVLFATGKFKEALMLLNKSLEIEKDKTRWNISLRLLNIMLFIELDKQDEASRALESTRKYAERMSKNEEVKPRDLLIIKVLRELEKDNFHYSSKNTNLVKMVKELGEKKKPVSWEHYSPELIPFHKWLDSRKGK